MYETAEMMWDSLSEFVDERLELYAPMEHTSPTARAICQELRIIDQKMRDLVYSFYD